MTIAEKVRRVADDLKSAGVSTAFLDAELLVASLFSWSRATLLASGNDPFDASLNAQLQAVVLRRVAREPLAYIFGEKEFYSLPFIVDPSVLIPRPETEMLVDYICKNAAVASRVHDLCCGSGAIAIAIKHNRPDLLVSGSDISNQACHIAQKNNERLIDGAVTFFESDLFDKIDSTFDYIVTNPPYVPIADKHKLEPELSFEPDLALFSEENGMNIPKKIIEQASAYIFNGGELIMEIGDHAVDLISAVAEQNNYACILQPDLAGYMRVAILKR